MNNPISLFKYIPAILPFLLIFTCTQVDRNDSTIASVKGRKISVNDFKDRAELTIRPAFLRGKNFNQKRIVLNSLIAEKILAHEAESDSQITRNEKLQKYVNGIKEQKMREMHFKRFALDQVTVDNNLVEDILETVNRSYDLSYFDISTSTNYDSIARILKDNEDVFSTTMQEFYPDQKLQRQNITWRDVINTELFEDLFKNRAEPGKIIGPVIRQDGRVFFFRVESWQNNIINSETDRQFIRSKIEQQIRDKKAAEKYDDVVSELMSGKELIFELDGLVQLINMLGPIFLKEDGHGNLLNDPANRFNREIRLDTLRQSSHLDEGITIFKVGSRMWSMNDVLNEIERHPLIFRKKRIAKKEFGESIKLALVNLVRDHFITKEAYKMGFDKTPEIQEAESLWTDHFYALLLREKYLSSKTDSLMHDLEYVSKKVGELRVKYTADIIVNEELLDETEIADVQLFAFQKNVPFPLVSPGFPLLTMDDK